MIVIPFPATRDVIATVSPAVNCTVLPASIVRVAKVGDPEIFIVLAEFESWTLLKVFPAATISERAVLVMWIVPFS